MHPRGHERQRPFYDDGATVLEFGRETVTVEHSTRDTWTGLYDHNGTPLHREPEPFGFKVRK